MANSPRPMENFYFLPSQRGGQLLVYKKYIYSYASKKEDVIRYRCQDRKCRGSIYIQNNIIIKEEGHTHPTVEEKIIAKKYSEKIKSLAKETNNSSTKIILDLHKEDDFCSNLICLPSIQSTKKKIKILRNKEENYQPLDFDDIPEELKKDKKGNLFLRYDSGFNDKNRYMIFFHNFKKEFLFSKCNVFLLDGTFRISPNCFDQVLVLHGLFCERSFPLVYTLVKGKSEENYKNILKKISEITNINPKIIITDFEKGLNNAVQSIFINTKLQLCFFHFTQSVWRRIQGEKLSTAYKKNIIFNKLIKKLMMIAFLHTRDVFNYYSIIKEQLLNCKEPNIKSFLEYFEYTYIGIKNLDEQKKPVFEVGMWNVHERIKNMEPKTTNHAEAWHRYINDKIRIKNPNIALFISSILESEEMDSIEYLRTIDGKITWPRKNWEKDLKIFFIIKNYDFFDNDKFVECVLKFYKFDFN